MGDKGRQRKPEPEQSTVPSTGRGAGLWGRFPSSPVGKRERDGLQGGSSAVATGEFRDCIRRPCTSCWEARWCSLHLSVFPLYLLTTIPLTSAEGGHTGRGVCAFLFLISHLITLPDFAAASTHLSNILLLTLVELKKGPHFIKWDQIKLVGFCSRASDMLPKSIPDTAQAVGN